MVLDEVPVPIVQAPMAGGPSTVDLAAAVAGAGALGFLAAGYKTAEALREDVRALRERTGRPFGVNVFVPAPAAAEPEVVAAYVARLQAEVGRHGAGLGTPRHDDDAWAEKLAVLAGERVAVVSFTFGLPDPAQVARLHDAGSEVWATVTDADEARLAVAAGADVLVVQGHEAGGHRASFADDPEATDLGLLAALALVRAAVDVPLVATGGIATGAGVAAVLAAGARAAQVGTALMRAPEAGTMPAHADRLAQPGATRLTRAFTGRRARGLVNRFLAEHSAAAPAAYPEVHHVTSPLRAAGRAAGDPEVVNLWAGQAHELARAEPAADIVRRLAAEARAALEGARALLPAD